MAFFQASEFAKKTGGAKERAAETNCHTYTSYSNLDAHSLQRISS
jgi:hypothetical protein